MVDAPTRLAAPTCAVCGAGIVGHVSVRLKGAGLYTCRVCGSWTYFPRAAAREQAAIHDCQGYFEHPYFKVRRVAVEAQRRRCRGVFARLFDAADVSSLRGQRMLDIGCDTGAFLKVAQDEFGIVPVGLDVAERSINLAKAGGVEAYQASIEEAPPELTDFQLITAIDLIEHVVDPHGFLQEIWKRLRPGGLLYVETPNIHSAVYRFGRTLSKVTGGRPSGLFERLFPPQHIQYFTERSFERLALDTGYEVVSLGTRSLQGADIAASFFAVASVEALQILDRLKGNGILMCAVLRRPMQGIE